MAGAPRQNPSRGNTSDRSTASAREAIGQLWLSMTLVQSRLLLLQLGAALLATAGIFKWYEKFEPFYNMHPVFSLSVIAGIPLYIICFSVGPQLWQRRRKAQRDAITLTPNPKGGSARYFRLDPYVTATPQEFRREDDAHNDVLRRIRETSRPVLFLSGASGAGKSSVLEAYVLPMLREEGWRVEQIRTFSDPLPQLEAVLTTSRRKGTRLLVVFDQFEEFALLEDWASAETRRLFLARLQQLCRLSPPGLCMLFSFRRDYMGDVIAMKIDDLIPGQTFMEIDAFRRGAARRFLEAAPAAPTSVLVERLLSGAEALDDVPARFRPITLNMLGLALQDYDREFTGRPERLVQSYVEAAISQPEIKEIAPRVIEKMITDANTKQPRTVADVAAETALSNQDVVACLVLLERKGLVRRLGDLWEVSHDFVARQFVLLLGRLRPNPWRKIGMFIASSLFILILSGAVIGIPIAAQQQAFAALRSLQISVAEGREGKPFAKFPDTATDATVTTALPHLILIGIGDLDLSSTRVRTLPSLDKLTSLTTLNLSNMQLTTLPSLDNLTALRALFLNFLPVTTLPSLDKLTSLTWLSIIGTQVTRLPSLDNLTALTRLYLMDSPITTLPSLDKLTSLTTLDLSNTQLTTLPSLDKLTSLTTLNLSRMQVRTLPSLDKLAALTRLDLRGMPVTTLPSLDKLTALTHLYLGDSRVTALPSLDMLTALTTLDLSHTRMTTPLPSLDKLTALTTLDLSYSRFTTLPSLDRLTALKELRLTGAHQLFDADESELQPLRSRGVDVKM
jgi:Leucine-rich repeat (LRR) protein